MTTQRKRFRTLELAKEWAKQFQNFTIAPVGKDNSDKLKYLVIAYK